MTSNDTVQELRDRCDISKWHDAGLLNTYRPDTPFNWAPLKALMLRAADELEAMRKQLYTAVKLGHHDTGDGFDWAVLRRIDELESENEVLTKSITEYQTTQQQSIGLYHAALKEMAERISERDAAESELERLREQLAEIHQSWGFRNEH